MKLFDVVLVSLCVVGLIISIYETMTLGLGHAYFPLMTSMGLFFWFVYRKKGTEA